MEAMPHLVIVFPQDSRDTAAVAELITRVTRSLREACGAAPTPLRPNLTTVCSLCIGDIDTITAAIQAVVDPYAQWLVLPAGKPFAASGLGAAVQVLNRGTTP